MGKIKIMDQALANLIAAGEVVERPLSVVKELVENSLDANSSQIIIELKNSGLDLIQVVDDGIGMDFDDAKICFLPHASSKLTSISMINKISTLGFRGEALSSIAAVSHIELLTCNGEHSTKVIIDSGKVITIESASFRQGTTVSVSKLFYNTPARLKYITNPYLELTKVVDYISRICLSNPHINIKLINDEKTIVSTSKSSDVIKTINDIYGDNISKEISRLYSKKSDFEIELYLAKPTLQRSNKSSIIVFVNKRVIYNTIITRAIIDAYMPYMPKNRYPYCIINLNIEPELIDVNIHPNKYEVKFSKETEIISEINTIITEFLQKERHIVNYSSVQKSPEIYVQEKIDLVRNVESTPSTNSYNTELIEKKDVLYAPIGQYDGTYILAQGQGELILIDQHAAQERINYEKNQGLVDFNNCEKRDLLVPITLSYAPSEAMLINEQLDILDNLGIEISSFGANDFIVRCIPSWLEQTDEKLFVEYIINRILNKSSVEPHIIVDDIIEMISCKESLKANSRITILEMEKLIDRLFKCANPYNCPHGRPTIVSFSTYEIEKLFKRVK